MYQISCPKCGTTFDPSLGGSSMAECPTCGQRMQVQLPDEPPPPAPAPRRRTGMDDAQPESQRRTGIDATPTPMVEIDEDAEAVPAGDRRRLLLVLLAVLAIGGVLMTGVIVIVTLVVLGQEPAPADTRLTEVNPHVKPDPVLPPPNPIPPSPNPIPPSPNPVPPPPNPAPPAPDPQPKPPMATVEELVKVLNEDKEEVARRKALMQLVERGEAARPAVSALLRFLRRPDEPEGLRLAVRSAVDKLGPLAPEHVPELRDLLSDAEWLPARLFAAEALGELGPDARPALPALLRAGGERKPEIRRIAATVLGKIGPEVRAEALDPLLRLLEDSDEEVRNAAGKALTSLGRPPEREVATLKRLLEDRTKPREVRQFAVWGLSEMGDVGVPALTEALEADPEVSVKCKAAAALGEQKVKTKEVGQALARAVEHPEKEVRLAATTALARIGFEPATLAGLLKALASDDADCRVVMGKTLPPMGALLPDSPRYRLPPESIGELRATLGSSEPVARAVAAYLLGTFGADAAAAVPELKRELPRERNEIARREMICALGAIGPAAIDAAPELRDIMKDRNEETLLAQRCAALALLRITDKEDLQPVCGVLARAMELRNATDPEAMEKEVHDRAKKALAQGKTKASAALVAAYKTVLQGPGEDKKEARKAALRVLTSIGPAAKLHAVTRSDSLFVLLDFVIRSNADDLEVILAAQEAANAIYARRR